VTKPDIREAFVPPTRANGARIGWSEAYVVSARRLWEELEKHRDRINRMILDAGQSGATGWKEHIGQRVEADSKMYVTKLAERFPDRPYKRVRTAEAVVRRMYDLETGAVEVCGADMAEMMLRACGVDMEHETTIEVYPGSLHSAREFIEIRRPSLKGEEFDAKVTMLLNYRDRRLWPDGWKGPNEFQLRNNAKRRAKKLAESTPLQNAMAART
jgi:hypothetical protein